MTKTVGGPRGSNTWSCSDHGDGLDTMVVLLVMLYCYRTAVTSLIYLAR